MSGRPIDGVLKQLESATKALRSMVTDDDGLDEVLLPAKAQRLLRERRARDETFGTLAGVLTETAFDIMLLLFVEEARGRLTSTSAASTAGGSPPTTGLRWLAMLAEHNLIERRRDPDDLRRIHIGLSDLGLDLMSRYLRRL